MKTSIFAILLSVMLVFLISCNNSPRKTVQMAERTITVMGSAEQEIVPDNIWFVIEIKEYYEGAYDYYGYDSYNEDDKIKLSEIEKLLKTDLNVVGIDTNNLITENIGNYYRYYGGDYLLSKQFKIQLDSMSKVEELMNEIHTKGIQYMRLGAMDHSEMETLRQEVKKEALLAARIKAEYLLESLDKNIGDVISIRETPNYVDYYSYPYSWGNEAYSNAEMPLEGSSNSGKKMKLRYEMEVVFEIQ